MRCLELVVTAFLLHSATSHAFETAALPPDPDHRLAAQAINRLGFDLFHRQSGKNPCISPYSIQLAMAMVANGTAGLTKEEFVKALHYPKDFSALNASMKALLAELGSHGELQTANRLYAQERKPIAPEFLEILSESYSAPLELLPFATQPEKSRQHINRWVKEATKDRISDALPAGSITSQTQFAFANAVHFKDNWVHQFRPEETTDQTFYLVEPLPERHTTPKVPTMMLFRDLGYLKRDTYTLVSLPFENGFEMLIVVPDERNGAYHLKEDFDAALMALLKKLPPQKVSLLLPKFETASSGVPLKLPLESLGLKTVFSPGADLSMIAAGGGPFLSDVYHSTFLKVDEFGAEFAAATIAPIAVSAGRTVRVDRPFLYVIRDPETSAILLMGRVDDPRKG